MTRGSDLVLSRAEVFAFSEQIRTTGRRLVFTNGVFDLLHIGHVRYLEVAHSLGEFLIVGINSDSSTSRLKGPGRPIVPEQERAELVAGLRCVDAVVIFDELTAVDLIKAIHPDVYVKGGDYGSLAEALTKLPEAPLVKRLGITLRILPFVEGRSTTQLIKRIAEHQAARDGGA